MTATRGSPEYFNAIFKDAVQRGMDIVDAVLDPFLEDGRPPLTAPVTLARLKKMPPQQAEDLLRAELRRTMKVDEETGMPVPDRETMRLIVEWQGWIADQTGDE
jgi:hypothetical protein